MNQMELLSAPSPAEPCLSNLRRTLKVENLGDAWRKKVVSAIRLKGQWLTEAGFEPGQRVAVVLLSPGVLEIRLTAVPEVKSEDNVQAPACRGERIPASNVHFDFWVSDHGSLSLFHPQTHKAHAWLKAHCAPDEEHRYWCGALAVEARFVADLVGRAGEDGLIVKL